jgi:uncharacterized protein YlzI (FlbEa/FlbD family)
MLIEVTKTYDTMEERASAEIMLLNSNHIVSINSQKEGSMITLADGTFVVVKESAYSLFERMEFPKTLKTNN